MLIKFTSILDTVVFINPVQVGFMSVNEGGYKESKRVPTAYIQGIPVKLNQESFDKLKRIVKDLKVD